MDSTCCRRLSCGGRVWTDDRFLVALISGTVYTRLADASFLATATAALESGDNPKKVFGMLATSFELSKITRLQWLRGTGTVLVRLRRTIGAQGCQFSDNRIAEDLFEALRQELGPDLQVNDERIGILGAPLSPQLFLPILCGLLAMLGLICGAFGYSLENEGRVYRISRVIAKIGTALGTTWSFAVAGVAIVATAAFA